MTNTVLIIDDDPHIREVIGFALKSAGYAVRYAQNGKDGLAEIQQNLPCLIVLDIGLPEMDGLEVCREVRKFSEVPVLFLTARDDEIDRIIGFEMGGDDYVTKPFSPREMVARVKAILKRGQSKPDMRDDLEWGDLRLDVTRHSCWFDRENIALTASEFTLLGVLLRRPDQVLTRVQITDAVYGHNIHVSARTIDSHVRNIRSKLALAGCKSAIITVHGVGLRMGDCTAK